MNKNKNIDNTVNNIKKKPLNSKKKTKIAVVLACIFLVYCIFLFVKLVKNPTETFIVEQGKIYKEESVNGYILRDEQLLENEEVSRQNSSVKGRRKKSS